MFKFGIIPGSLGILCINWVSGHLMCIIQIWTTSTWSFAPKFAEKSHVGWIYRSHARNGNEIQTSGRRGSAGKIEKLGLLIDVNPKHAWKSWNLAYVMTWHQQAAIIFLAELGQALVYASCKPELPTRRLVVPRGNVSPPCVKRHTYTAFFHLNFFARAD